MQDTPSDDEPAPLVGEKRVRDDDDDPLFATGTQTGTGDENQNDDNEDGTRTEPEVEEEESGPASPVFNQAHKPPGRQKRKPRMPSEKPRMIVKKHPVVRSTKGKQAKSRKSLELDSDDGVELEFGDVDKTPSRKEYS